MSQRRPIINNVAWNAFATMKSQLWKSQMRSRISKSEGWRGRRRELIREQAFNAANSCYLPNMYWLSPTALNMSFEHLANPNVDLQAMGENYHLVLGYLCMDFGKTSAEIYAATSLSWTQIGEILRNMGGWLLKDETEKDLYTIMPSWLISKLPVDMGEKRRVIRPLLEHSKYLSIQQRMGVKFYEYTRIRDKLVMVANEHKDSYGSDFKKITELMYLLRKSPVEVTNPVTHEKESVSLSDREINLLVIAEVLRFPMRCYYSPVRVSSGRNQADIIYVGPPNEGGKYPYTRLIIDKNRIGEETLQKGGLGVEQPIRFFNAWSTAYKGSDPDSGIFRAYFGAEGGELDVIDWERSVLTNVHSHVSRSRLATTMRAGGYTTRWLNLPQVTNILDVLE